MTKTIVREMALTWEEFERLLPIAAGDTTYQVRGRCVQVTLSPSDALCIELGETGERKIASISLPVTRVTFDYQGNNPDRFTQFLERFDRYFQRGGG